MKYAVDIPNFGRWGDPREVARLAADVEAAGWDGLTLWDHILVWDGAEVTDPWIALAAAASATDRIKLVTAVTPIPRRTPWKLAREVTSLDHLSEGRFVLGVGIGWPTDPEFTRFAGPTDLRTRADMLDEGLAIIEGLWTGEPFAFDGEHYRLETSHFLPTPVQEPRVPIWVAGMWPNRRPFRRAARYEGVMPIFIDDSGDFTAPTPELIAEVAGYIARHRASDGPYDITVAAMAHGKAAVDVADFAAAGATWWLEQWHPDDIDHDSWLERVRAGPPG
jgi:alkanesulfonate monooxygenase SsuD/methylene tetrahydromethanopterin reductase-like flavin-dependent oxidoreductase (luciferase family)